MAKSKGTAYDIGDILGVKEPADEAETKKATASKPKATKQKQTRAKAKSVTKPAEDHITPYKEKRDKRLQAVIPTRLYNDLKIEADNAGVSVNEVVNTLLENGLRKRG